MSKIYHVLRTLQEPLKRRIFVTHFCQAFKYFIYYLPVPQQIKFIWREPQQANCTTCQLSISSKSFLSQDSRTLNFIRSFSNKSGKTKLSKNNAFIKTPSDKYHLFTGGRKNKIKHNEELLLLKFKRNNPDATSKLNRSDSQQKLIDILYSDKSKININKIKQSGRNVYEALLDKFSLHNANSFEKNPKKLNNIRGPLKKSKPRQEVASLILSRREVNSPEVSKENESSSQNMSKALVAYQENQEGPENEINKTLVENSSNKTLLNSKFQANERDDRSQRKRHREKTNSFVMTKENNVIKYSKAKLFKKHEPKLDYHLKKLAEKYSKAGMVKAFRHLQNEYGKGAMKTPLKVDKSKEIGIKQKILKHEHKKKMALNITKQTSQTNAYITVKPKVNLSSIPNTTVVTLNSSPNQSKKSPKLDCTVLTLDLKATAEVNACNKNLPSIALQPQMNVSPVKSEQLANQDKDFKNVISISSVENNTVNNLTKTTMSNEHLLKSDKTTLVLTITGRKENQSKALEIQEKCGHVNDSKHSKSTSDVDYKINALKENTGILILDEDNTTALSKTRRLDLSKIEKPDSVTETQKEKQSLNEIEQNYTRRDCKKEHMLHSLVVNQCASHLDCRKDQSKETKYPEESNHSRAKSKTEVKLTNNDSKSEQKINNIETSLPGYRGEHSVLSEKKDSQIPVIKLPDKVKTNSLSPEQLVGLQDVTAQHIGPYNATSVPNARLPIVTNQVDELKSCLSTKSGGDAEKVCDSVTSYVSPSLSASDVKASLSSISKQVDELKVHNFRANAAGDAQTQENQIAVYVGTPENKLSLYSVKKQVDEDKPCSFSAKTSGDPKNMGCTVPEHISRQHNNFQAMTSTPAVMRQFVTNPSEQSTSGCSLAKSLPKSHSPKNESPLKVANSCLVETCSDGKNKIQDIRNKNHKSMLNVQSPKQSHNKLNMQIHPNSTILIQPKHLNINTNIIQKEMSVTNKPLLSNKNKIRSKFEIPSNQKIQLPTTTPSEKKITLGKSSLQIKSSVEKMSQSSLPLKEQPNSFMNQSNPTDKNTILNKEGNGIKLTQNKEPLKSIFTQNKSEDNIKDLKPRLVNSEERGNVRNSMYAKSSDSGHIKNTYTQKGQDKNNHPSQHEKSLLLTMVQNKTPNSNETKTVNLGSGDNFNLYKGAIQTNIITPSSDYKRDGNLIKTLTPYLDLKCIKTQNVFKDIWTKNINWPLNHRTVLLPKSNGLIVFSSMEVVSRDEQHLKDCLKELKDINVQDIIYINPEFIFNEFPSEIYNKANIFTKDKKGHIIVLVVTSSCINEGLFKNISKEINGFGEKSQSFSFNDCEYLKKYNKQDKLNLLRCSNVLYEQENIFLMHGLNKVSFHRALDPNVSASEISKLSTANLETQKKVEFKKGQEQPLQNVPGSGSTKPSKESETHNEYDVERATNIQNCGNEVKQKPSDVSFLEVENGSLSVRYKPKSSDEKVPKSPSIINSKHMSSYTKCTDIPVESNESLNDTRIIQLFETTFKDNENQTQNKRMSFESPRIEKQKYTINFRDLIKFVKSGRENIRSINSHRNSLSSLKNFSEKSSENTLYKKKEEKINQESMPHEKFTEVRKIHFGNYGTQKNVKNFPVESKTFVGDNIKPVSQNDSIRTGMVGNNSIPSKESFGSGEEKYIGLSNDKLEHMNNTCSNNVNNTTQNQLFHFAECPILKMYNSKNNKTDIIQLNRTYKRHDSTEKEYLSRKNKPKSPKLKIYKKSNITAINEEDPVRKYVKKFKHKTLGKQKVNIETAISDKNTKNSNKKTQGEIKSLVNDGHLVKDNSNKILKSGVWQTKTPKQAMNLFGYSSDASKPVNKDNENINGQIINNKKCLSDEEKIKQIIPMKVDSNNDVISKPINIQSSKKHHTSGERVRENGTSMNERESSVNMNKDYEVGINAHNLQVNASSKEEGGDTSIQVNIQYVVNKSRKPESKLSESCQNRKSQSQVIEILKPPKLKTYNQIKDKKTGDFKELISYIKDNTRISNIQNIIKDKKSGSFEELTSIIKKSNLKNIDETPEAIPQCSKINCHNSLPKNTDTAPMVCNTKRVINEKNEELEETLRREMNYDVFKEKGKQKPESKEQPTNLMLFVDVGKGQKSEVDKKAMLENEKYNFSKIKEVGIENENKGRHTDLCVKSNDTLTNNIQNVENILVKKHRSIEECSNPKPFVSADAIKEKVEDENKTNLNDGVMKTESAISKKIAPLRIIFENSPTVNNNQPDDKISVLDHNNNTKEFQKSISEFESVSAKQNSSIAKKVTSSEIKLLPTTVNGGKETDSENPIITGMLSEKFLKVESKINSSELPLSSKIPRVKSEVDMSNLKIQEKPSEGKQISKSHSDSLLTNKVDTKESFKEFVLKNKENHLEINEEISEVGKDKPSTKFPFREDSDNKALTEKIKQINNTEQKNIISKLMPQFATQNPSNQIACEKEQIFKNSIPVIDNVRIKLNILDETRKDSPSSDDVELQIDLQNKFKVDHVPSPSRFIKERKENTKEAVEQSNFYDLPDNSKKLAVKERTNELLCQKGEIKETSKKLGISMSISEKPASDNFKQSTKVDSNYKKQQNVFATESVVLSSQDYIANKRGSTINNEKVKKLFLNSTISNIVGKTNEYSEEVQRNKQNELESKSFKEETMCQTAKLKTGVNQNYQKLNQLFTPHRLKSRFKMIHLVTKQIKSDAFKRSETSKFNPKNDRIADKNRSKGLDGFGNSLQNQYEINAKYYIEGVSLQRIVPPSISGKEGFISQSLRSESISAPSSVLFNGSSQRVKKKEVTPEAIKFRISKYRHYKKEEKDKRVKYTDNATQRVTKRTINNHLLTSPNLQKLEKHITVTQQSKHNLLSDGNSQTKVNTLSTSRTKICFERNEPSRKKTLPVSHFACTTPSIAVHKTKMKKKKTNKKGSQNFQGMLEEYNAHNNGMQNNQLNDGRGNVIAPKVLDSSSELIIMPEARDNSLGTQKNSKCEPPKNRIHAFSEQKINSACLVFEQSKPKKLLPLIRTEKSIKVFEDPEMQQNNECTHCPTEPLNLVRNELSDFSITPKYEEDKNNKMENIKIPSKKAELTSLMGNVVTNVKNKLQGIPTSMSKLMAQTQTQKNWFDISDVVKNKLLEDFTLTSFQKKFKNLQKDMLQSDKANTPYFVLGKFDEPSDLISNKEGKITGNNKSNSQSEISKCNTQDTSDVQEKSAFETTKGLEKKKKVINKKKKFKEKNKMEEMLKFEINKNNIGHKKKTSPHLAYSDLLNNLYVKYVNSQTKDIGFSEKVT